MSEEMKLPPVPADGYACRSLDEIFHMGARAAIAIAPETGNFEQLQNIQNWLLSKDALKLDHTEESDGFFAPSYNIISSIEAMVAAASQQAEPKAAQGEEIDNPEFMGMMNTFMQESSSEEFNEEAYNAARAALVQHIRQLGNVQYIRGYDRRKSEQDAQQAPKAAMTEAQRKQLSRCLNGGIHMGWISDIEANEIGDAIEAASGPNLALVEALKEIRASLHEINDNENGPITDTLWMRGNNSKTIFDAIGAALAAAGVSLEAK